MVGRCVDEADALVDEQQLPRGRPLRLQNLGNTCFANAVVQALLHSPVLSRVLARLGVSKDPVINEIRSFAECFLDGKGPQCRPKELVGWLREQGMNGKAAAGGLRRCQEDAHAFATKLFTHLSFASRSDPDQPSLFCTTIGGAEAAHLACACCSHQSCFRPVPSFGFTFVLNGAVSLEAALAQRWITGPTDVVYKCPVCPSNEGKQSLPLWMAPRVLFATIQKYTYDGKKLMHHVSFPERLNLSRFMQVCVA